MKSDFLERLLIDQYIFKEMEPNDPLYEKYNKNNMDLNNLGIKPYTSIEFLEAIKSSIYFDAFRMILNNINSTILYKSEGHGIYHNERVALFIFFIAIKEDLLKDINLLLDAAMYHDVGRINDFEDQEHGDRSSKNIGFLYNSYNKEDIKILKAIIKGHCLDDNMFEAVASEFEVKDLKRTKLLYDALKDADALDRVRLSTDGLDINFLRTKTAKALSSLAYLLYYNFQYIRNNSSMKK